MHAWAGASSRTANTLHAGDGGTVLDVSACVSDASGDTGCVAAKKSPAKKTAKKATAKKVAVKRGPGRPPRAEKAANAAILLRLTDTERDQVADAADAEGLTVVAFVRRAVFSAIRKR